MHHAHSHDPLCSSSHHDDGSLTQTICEFSLRYSPCIHQCFAFLFCRTPEIPQGSLTRSGTAAGTPHHHTHGHPQGGRGQERAHQRCNAEHRGCPKTLSPPWFANQMLTTPCAPGGRADKPAQCYREGGRKGSVPPPRGPLYWGPLWNQMQEVSMWEDSKYEV